MPETIVQDTPKKRGRPKKNQVENIVNQNVVEVNSQVSSPIDNIYENNSFVSTGVWEQCFGLDIFKLYTPKEIHHMIESPMVHNQALRKLSMRLYSSCGLLTQCIDYCTSLPTLDYVVIPKGKSNNKKNQNKSVMESSLKTLHHKELMRDALFKSMIEGVAFYYVEFTSSKTDMLKTMSDYDVENILEINDVGVNMMAIPLPADFTKIVGRVNSVYKLAFDVRYFEQFLTDAERTRKLRFYPEEIRQAWTKYHKGLENKPWVVLDHNKTIVSKVRSKMEEAWGRPLCLAAIKNILQG